MSDNPKQNIRQIRETIAKIDAIKRDYEAAHSMEDELLECTLRMIAAGAPNPQEMATEALRVKYLKFLRVCA